MDSNQARTDDLMETNPVVPEAPRGWSTWTEPTILFLILLAVTCLYCLTDRDPVFWDEYYHLLAARSWAENGTLAVGEGVYNRAPWLSITVGWLFRTFGESIALARIPGAIALSLWGLFVFLWVRAVGGRAAGWFASLAFALSPMVLVNAVMVRFYGVAGLLFWLGCMAAFVAAIRGTSRGRRYALAGASILFLFLCFEVTQLARLWIACLTIWLAGIGAVEAGKSKHRWKILGLAAMLVIAAALWMGQSEWVAGLWEHYRTVPLWNAEEGSSIRYYEWLFRRDYPTLWTFLPLAGIIAVARRPHAGSMSVVVFVAGVVLLSFGAPKAPRYMISLMPFFFAMWGIALTELIAGLRGQVSSFLRALRLTVVLPAGVGRLSGHLLMAFVLAFVFLTNPGFSGIRHVLPGQTASVFLERNDGSASPKAWEDAATVLRPLLDEVDVVITSNPLHTLYHVGDYDFAMRPSVIEEVSPPSEFGMDSRTGHPAISTLGSLQRLVAENAHGLVFGERRRWNHPTGGFTAEVTEYVVRTMARVPLPDNLEVTAYRW